ncbi:MAG TPA: hypothetical protein VHA33_02345 [Candidatus Angelobacter sp.]|nr:hypothetical protein [Candidatus Angelobacter sp.]
MENPFSMKARSIILLLIVVFVNGIQIACHQPSHHQWQSRVVLPNAELLNCRFGECAQMWSTVGAKPGAITPWRVTIERLGNDPCPNGIIALYDKNVSMEELVNAVTERYGSAALKGAVPGGIWKDASKNLVIDLIPLADESSPEEHPSADAMQRDPVVYALTTDAFHDSVGRSVPRKELKELIFLSTFGTSCGVPREKLK